LNSTFVKFDNSATIFLEVSWESYMEPGISLSLFGNKGGMKWDNWKEIRIFRDEENLPVTVIPKLSQEEDVESSFHYFVSAVLDPGMKMMVSGEESLKVMKVLEAIKQSSEERQTIVFP
jgi:predicted dehydrogenase